MTNFFPSPSTGEGVGGGEIKRIRSPSPYSSPARGEEILLFDSWGKGNGSHL